MTPPLPPPPPPPNHHLQARVTDLQAALATAQAAAQDANALQLQRASDALEVQVEGLRGRLGLLKEDVSGCRRGEGAARAPGAAEGGCEGLAAGGPGGRAGGAGAGRKR